MRGRWIVAWTLAVAACGSHAGDECDRVIARLHRLDLIHHRSRGPSWIDDQARTQCREGGWDPVVNCAIAGPTDEAADACIERGLRATLGLDRDAPLAPREAGKGLNPLLGE